MTNFGFRDRPAEPGHKSESAHSHKIDSLQLYRKLVRAAINHKPLACKFGLIHTFHSFERKKPNY